MSDELIQNPFRIRVEYKYTFEDGQTAHFLVNEDLASKEMTCYSSAKYSWAELDFNKCDNCPLKSSEYKYCPAALSIIDIIEFFSKKVSFSKCKCEVNMIEKTVIADKSLQDALYPLIGLRMATSKCPFLSRFKPMARFHEPFSNPYYTICRTISFYLMGQYFKHSHEKQWDWDFKGLKEFYKNINIVNSKMAARLNEAEVLDATPNCLVILSIFGTSINYFFDEYIKVLKQLFQISGVYDDKII